MKLRFACCLSLGMVLSFSGSVFAQQILPATESSESAAPPAAPPTDSSSPPAPQQATPAPPRTAPTTPPKHMLGPLEISVNWRTRAEGWNWFQGNTGNSDYGLWDSLLRVGIGQTGEHFDWFLEGEQPSILGLPDNAVVAAPQGQLGLGGSYYAANQQSHRCRQRIREAGVCEFQEPRAGGYETGPLRIF